MGGVRAGMNLGQLLMQHMPYAIKDPPLLSQSNVDPSFVVPRPSGG